MREMGTEEESPRRPCSEMAGKRDEVYEVAVFRNRSKTDTGIKNQELLGYNRKQQDTTRKIPQPLEIKGCGRKGTITNDKPQQLFCNW